MVNLDDFEWTLDAKKEIGGIRVSVYYSKIPGRRRWYGIGVDPGRNYGICTLTGREAWVQSGTFAKEPAQWKYGVAAYEYTIEPRNYHGQGPAVIEGAAYGKIKGQPDLAHTRMGFVLGLRAAGHTVDIRPPATIRANALGKGSTSGLEVWPNLNHNAADAVACALFAAGLTKEQVEGSHLE